ncbi:hypothetical protein TNCV_2885861 [Trichonephila clavipes]|nr:hypothetical protein TNCV_2885861 [Trichonephila clavipes]
MPPETKRFGRGVEGSALPEKKVTSPEEYSDIKLTLHLGPTLHLDIGPILHSDIGFTLHLDIGLILHSYIGLTLHS